MSAKSVLDRLSLLIEQTSTGSGRPVSIAEALDRLQSIWTRPDEGLAYLALAVMRSSIPTAAEVVRFRRAWRVDGIAATMRPLTRRVRFPLPAVRIANGLIVDVTDTSRSRFTTGIQRVARESLVRWPSAGVELVSWQRGRARLVAVTDEERGRVVGGNPRSDAPAHEVIVPFEARFFLPEIAVDPVRTPALRVIAEFARCHTVAIGFDCIPVSTAEYVSPAMPGAFSKYLSTLSEFDDVVAISASAGDEFRGWRSMLRGAGLTGPEISVAELPFSAEHVDDAAVTRTRRSLGLDDDTTVVLSVGSHEPRKNHLALLEAAEVAWRSGREFALVMVGGNSWDTYEFDTLVERLRDEGRQVLTPSKVDDETIWSLYRTARFSVFCSFNEGFGLPVAESLASGTPVIASDRGSMRTLAAGNGGVLVDPFEPGRLAAEMIRLLDDDDVIESLREQSSSVAKSSWDVYASTLWSVVDRRRIDSAESATRP